uniref:Uncharacterized protein n=1 Tax=viral metagenome TaxID=1070528 RepID=A0A6C0DLF5_9ZZZZ
MPSSKFVQIMLFYILLSFFIMPLLFYFLINKTDASAGNGFVVGSILSLLLWFVYGSKMIK